MPVKQVVMRSTVQARDTEEVTPSYEGINGAQPRREGEKRSQSVADFRDGPRRGVDLG